MRNGNGEIQDGVQDPFIPLQFKLEQKYTCYKLNYGIQDDR